MLTLVDILHNLFFGVLNRSFFLKLNSQGFRAEAKILRRDGNALDGREMEGKNVLEQN